jgi:hypothetical protein
MWGSYVKNPGYGYGDLIASTQWHNLLDDLFDGLNSAASWQTYNYLQTWLEDFVNPWWGGWLVWTGGWWDTAAAQLYDPSSTTWRFWGSWWVVWHGDWDYETDPVTGENTNTFIQWGDWWGGWLVWTGGWWQYVMNNPQGMAPDMSNPWSLWGGWLVWTGGWFDLAYEDGVVVTQQQTTGIPASLAGMTRAGEVAMEEWFVWGTHASALPSAPETFTKENPQVWLNDPPKLHANLPPTLSINKQLPIYAKVGQQVSFTITATNPNSSVHPTINGYNLPVNSVFNKNKSMGVFKYTPPVTRAGSTSTLLFTASNASGTTELEVKIIYQL